MNSGELIFSKDLCRLCLWRNHSQVPIFEAECEDQRILRMIHTLLPFKVSRDDRLPENVCSDCLYKLEMFYDFYTASARAHNKLLKYLIMLTVESQRLENPPHTEPPIVFLSDEDEETTKAEPILNEFGLNSDDLLHNIHRHVETSSDVNNPATILEGIPAVNDRSSLSVDEVSNTLQMSCSQCYQKFSSRADLSFHSCKSITCCYCDNTFRSIKELAAHKRIHFSAPSNSCKHCGTDLKSPEALKNHMDSHSCYMVLDRRHKSGMADKKRPVKPTKTYTCDMCNLSFDLLRGFARHIKSRKHKRHVCIKRWKNIKSKGIMKAKKYTFVSSKDTRKLLKNQIVENPRVSRGNETNNVTSAVNSELSDVVQRRNTFITPDEESYVSSESHISGDISETRINLKRKINSKYPDNSWILNFP